MSFLFCSPCEYRLSFPAGYLVPSKLLLPTWYLFVSNQFYVAARIPPRRLFHFSVFRNKKMAKGRNKLAKGGKKLKNSGGDRDARLFFFPSMASDGRRRKGEEGRINI